MRAKLEPTSKYYGVARGVADASKCSVETIRLKHPSRHLTPSPLHLNPGNVHFEDVVRRVSVGDLPGNRAVSAFGAGAAAAAAASASGAEGSTEAESQAEVLQMFRQTVRERGARGIIG